MIFPNSTIDVGAVAQHYNELDVFYREIWGEHVHHGLWLTGRETRGQAVLQLADHVARLAQIQPGHTVCDVGSGYGATACYLAQLFGAQVTALTVTPVQHEYACARQSGATNPCYLLRNWLENGFPVASFDRVISIESSEHMPDKERFFAEAARVLKPGGRLVVCAWLACEQPQRWEIRHLLEPICREGRLAGMGTETEYRQLLQRAGLVLDQFEDLSCQVKRTWTICIMRLLRVLLLRSACRRFLLDRRQRERVFAKTVPRIRAAYATGSMRYGVFSAHVSEAADCRAVRKSVF